MRYIKIMSAVLSLLIVGASLPLTNYSLNENAVYASDEIAIKYVANDITYYVYGNHALLKGCNIHKAGKVVIPSTVKGVPVTVIGDNSFSGCDDITEIVIPDTVERIEGEAFRSCESLVSVTIGKNVKEIYEYVFAYCPLLKEITIPDSVTEMFCECFRDCKALKKAVLGKGLTVVPYATFQNCSSLTSVTLRGAVTEIEDFAFEGSGLTSFKFPDTLTECGGAAFRGCKNLQSVDLGNKITGLNSSVFESCESLKNIVIPDSVKFIGTRAFAYSNIQRIVLGRHVKYIGEGAMEGCDNLEEVTVRNPKCEIVRRPFSANGKNYDLTLGLSNYTVLIGLEDSTIEKYAHEYRYFFMSIVNDSVGDVNSDGMIDSVDASEVMKMYADISTKGTTPKTDIFKVYDVNNDTKIDSFDASKILEYYAYISAKGDGANVDITTFVLKK